MNIPLEKMPVRVSAEGETINLVRRKSSRSQRLFPFERVFEAADGVLTLGERIFTAAKYRRHFRFLTRHEKEHQSR